MGAPTALARLLLLGLRGLAFRIIYQRILHRFRDARLRVSRLLVRRRLRGGDTFLLDGWRLLDGALVLGGKLFLSDGLGLLLGGDGLAQSGVDAHRIFGDAAQHVIELIE